MFVTDSSAADAVELADLTAIRSLLAGVTPAAGTSVLAAQIRALRELGSVLAAAEASVTAAFVAGRRAEQVAAGVPARRVGQGVHAEVALTRRESPNRAGRYAGFARILTRELPATFAALQAGETTEWRAMLLARETGWLSAEHRAVVDADLGPQLHALGDRAVEAKAASLAYSLDPHGKIRAITRAAGGRHVSLRPAPDGQCRFNATLPLAQGVAAYAALCRAADAARAAGDERGRGQVMADELVTRVTGQIRADAVPLRVDLVITEQALLGTGPGADAPATVSGHGPIPAPYARDLITRTAGESAAMVRIRGLFTDPAGRLVTMETSSRDFTPAMAEFIRLRDQICATPYCGAPIRHIDHRIPWAEGGPTSLANAQGLCEACNYAKQAPGWTATPMPDRTVRTITPTGHHTRARTPGSTSPAHRRPRGRPRRATRRAPHQTTAPPDLPLTTTSRLDYADPPGHLICYYAHPQRQ